MLPDGRRLRDRIVEYEGEGGMGFYHPLDSLIATAKDLERAAMPGHKDRDMEEAWIQGVDE